MLFSEEREHGKYTKAGMWKRRRLPGAIRAYEMNSRRKNGRFVFSSRELEILIHLDRTGSVGTTAQAMGCVPNVVTRELQRMNAKAPVATKIERRWTLTPLGAELARNGREMLRLEAEALQTDPRPKLLLGGLAALCAVESPALFHPLVIKSDCQLASHIPVPEAAHRLASGILDLVVTESEIPSIHLVRRELARMEMVEVQSSRHSGSTPLESDLFRSLGFVEKREAVRHGLAFGLLPRFLVAADLRQGALVERPHRGEPIVLRAFYPPHRRKPLDALWALLSALLVRSKEVRKESEAHLSSTDS